MGHVIDASVAIKWFVYDVHAESAHHLLADVYALYALVETPVFLIAVF